MVKKCIVCNEEAEFKIKDTSDYYCKECADENFADLTMLVHLENEARILRGLLREKMNDISQKEDELDQMLVFNDKPTPKKSERKEHQEKEDATDD